MIVKKGIQNDQDEDTWLLSERLETCETRISQNSQTISDSQTKLEQAQEQVGPLEQKLLDKRHQSEDKEGEEQRNNDRINKLIQYRQDSIQQFESKRDELTSIVGALSEAKKIIASIKTDPTALIQLKNHKDNICNYRESNISKSDIKIIHVLHFDSFNPFFNPIMNKPRESHQNYQRFN